MAAAIAFSPLQSPDTQLPIVMSSTALLHTIGQTQTGLPCTYGLLELYSLRFFLSIVLISQAIKHTQL